MAELQTEHCKKLLEELPEPKIFWKWMLWCAEIPRGSGNTDTFRAKLIEAGKKLGFEVHTDAAKNVKIVKPATKGYEKAPTVCLQAHMDIVNAQTRDDYNPLTDGVKPLVKDGWLCADRTSLGADDGMGIAAAMAILERNDLEHPKIEFLCTNDEESDTSGAIDIAPDFLCPNTKYIINIDSEDKEALCLGSAGGGDVNIFIPLKRVQMEGVPLSVNISGLSGGHSGCDIHLFKANSFKILARVLLSAWDTGFTFAHMEGGSARNSIPTFASCVVIVPKDKLSDFEKKVQETHKILLEEYSTHEKNGFDIAVTPGKEMTPVSRESTKAILHMWKLAPSFPLRMSPDIDGLVESSCSITMCNTLQDTLEVLGLARTSRESQWQDIEQQLEALAELTLGGKVTITGKYPGWLPVPDSKLSKVAQESHVAALGKPCKVYAVHAGLECGMLLEKYPKCEAVSVGPQVENPHTVNERCEISSGVDLLCWLIHIIKQLKE